MSAPEHVTEVDGEPVTEPEHDPDELTDAEAADLALSRSYDATVMARRAASEARVASSLGLWAVALAVAALLLASGPKPKPVYLVR